MKKALVTGGFGLLGTEIQKIRHDFLYPTRQELDLENQQQVLDYFKNNEGNFDTVIHLAAKVGGVKANSDYVSDFFRQNMNMNMNVLQACFKSNVKLVSILSTCIYPDYNYVKYPLTEEQLHSGPPHSSNFGYAYAKRMLDVQSRAYRQQHGCNFVTVIPNNLYGINDNYDLNSGHVIPSLIRKFYEAKLENRESVRIWGSGKPLREFTFARDIAKIIMWVAENYEELDPVNIGNVEQISIKNLAEIICKEIGYQGNMIFDETKPDGQYEKSSSNEKLKRLGYSQEYTSLEDGLRETIKHFTQTYPHVRGY